MTAKPSPKELADAIDPRKSLHGDAESWLNKYSAETGKATAILIAASDLLRTLTPTAGQREAAEEDRLALATALAKLDGVTLIEINSTVGDPNNANAWRKYLGRADDLCSILSRHSLTGGVSEGLAAEFDALAGDDAWLSPSKLTAAQLGMWAFNHRTEISRALKHAPADDGWRDMSSAPKDGSNILAIDSTGEQIVLCWEPLVPGGGDWIFARTRSGEIATPHMNLKHWRPLPPPPIPTEGEEKV